MRVIILHGAHNSGKTTTFNLLYDELLKKGAKPLTIRHELPARDDFECILEYKEKRVALFSLGDYMFAIGSAVGYYTKEECDILVVAHSLKNTIHENVLFKARKYPFEIIYKELDGKRISDEDAVEKIIEKIE